MKLDPHIPFRPTEGLVALFARTGTRSRTPRAPHLRVSCNLGTYAEVTKLTMEGGGANQGRGVANSNGSGRGYQSGGRGAGQGGMIGRGFQSQPFNPGYGGGATPGYGHGGARYPNT